MITYEFIKQFRDGTSMVARGVASWMRSASGSWGGPLGTPTVRSR